MEAPHEQSVPLRRKRRWRRRLAVAAVVAVAGAVWLNGPGVRWLGRLALGRALPQAGLAGDLRVEGTILGGLALRDVDLTGGRALQRLKAGEIAVSYRLGELAGGRVRGLRVRDLAAVVELNAAGSAAAEPAPAREPPGLEAVVQQIRDGLAKGHRFVDPLDLDLRGVAVDVRRDGRPVLALGPSDVVHRGAGAPVEVRLGEIVHGGGRTIPAQQFAVSWTPASVEVTPWAPLPRWWLRDLKVDTGGSAPLLCGAVAFEDRRLDVEVAPDARRVAARFSGEPLPWSAVAEALGLGGEFQFELRQLDLEVEGIGGPAADWRSSVQLSAGALAWRQWQGDALRVETRQRGARAGAEWELTALGGVARGSASTRWPDAAKLLEEPCPPRVEGTLAVERADEVLTAVRGRVAVPQGDAPFPGRSLDATWALDLEAGRPSAATVELEVAPAAGAGGAPPPLEVTAGWTAAGGIDARLATAGVAARVAVDAGMNVYQGSLDVQEPGVAALRGWAAAFAPGLPAGITAVAGWSGTGTLDPPDHRGRLDLQQFRWEQPDQPPLDAGAEVTYQWPGPAVEIAGLRARRGELAAEARGKLADGRLELPELSVAEGAEVLATGSASIPLAEDPADWRALFQLEEPWQLDLATSELALERINRWLPPQQKIPARGSVRAEVALAGSPATPRLTARLTGAGLQAAADGSQVPPAALAVTLETRDGRLEAAGRLQPQGWSPLVLEGSAPLDHAKWLADPQAFRDARVRAKVEVPRIDLARLGPLPAAVRRLTGSLDARVTLTGTPAQPRFDGAASLRGFGLDLTDERFPPVRDGRAELRLSGSRIELTALEAGAAGGRLRGGGTVDLGDPKDPGFDVRVDGTALPAWRDPSTIVRLDAGLRLRGRLTDATLGGGVARVQGLYFRDFELIPIGIPFTTPSKPSLPKVDAPAGGAGGPAVPAPFAGWKLDVEFLTQDPFLVRGNLAQGAVSGRVRVGGTLGEPAPRGEFTIDQFDAQLPLSRLRVRGGKVRFRPEAPFAPALEIRGTSELRPYEINVFVHGTAAAPEISFTSSPPLPENEILTLLATGATSTDLERQGAASNKAIQLLLEEARRGRLRYGKFLKPVLEVLKDVDVRIGEVDAYTGRDYTSATLRLGDRWLTSFSIDDDNRSRGLLIFVLRFR